MLLIISYFSLLVEMAEASPTLSAAGASQTMGGIPNQKSDESQQTEKITAISPFLTPTVTVR